MIKTFNTTKENGPMSERMKYYDKSLTRLEVEKDLLKRRIELGEKLGFDGTKIIIPRPSCDLYKYGYVKDVTKDIEEIVHDDPTYDLWNVDYLCDIMLIRSNLEGIVLGSLTSDCPVLVASVKDTFGIANCTAKDIDKELPVKLIDAIQKSTNAKTSEIEVYVGPSAGRNYEYINYPNWAKNSIWKNTIEKSEEGYKIDLKKTIMIELLNRGIKMITMSNVDTISDPAYYSHYATINGIEEKRGRILVGAFKQKSKTK